MSYSVLVRFAPCVTADRVDNPRWPSDRTMYNGMGLLPIDTPLVLNHDMDQRLGLVEKVHRLDAGDGYWYCASATLDADPPPWLRRGCPVSFGFFPGLEREWNLDGAKAEVFTGTLVKEVSVLHGVRPADPDAQVMVVQRVKDSPPKKPAAVGGHPVVAGGVIPGDGRILRRPATGQILGVR